MINNVYIYKKTWSRHLLPVPRFKGSRIAQLAETSNVESPTPMYVYKSTISIAPLRGRNGGCI